MTIPRLALALFLSFFCNFSFADRVVFEMIDGALSADDMSPDGRFVVGWTDVDGNGFPDGTYLWDRSTDVMTTLPPEGMSAVAVSDDGQFVVGDVPDPEGVGTNVAGRWSVATGWESLGRLPNAGACPSRSDSYEISADGSTVVGLSWDGCSGRGFVWQEDTGMLELQNLANGNNRASVVSSDGTLIGGFAQGSFSRTPAVWSSDTSGVLLDPPSGDDLGEVFGIRDDGSLLLGQLGPQDGSTPVAATKWEQDSNGIWQPETIGSGTALPGWSGIAMDIADNDTTVGFDIILTNRRAWIQPNGEGDLLDMRTYFQDNGADIPNRLIIEVAQAISTNGRIIVGHGFATGGWLAKILADCDFDGNVACDIDDIDALVMAISSGSTDPQFDLNDDGSIDTFDLDEWRSQAGAENLVSGNAYLVGDANLDGLVDGQDFIDWNSNKFSPTGKWSQADFNADGVTDGQDFVLWNEFKFMQADAVAVPEPAGWALALFGLFCLLHRQ